MEFPAFNNSVLYRFMPASGTSKFSELNLKDLFLKSKVRLTSHFEVNDPADGSPFYDENIGSKHFEKYLELFLTTEKSDVDTERMRFTLLKRLNTRAKRLKYIKDNRSKLLKVILSYNKLGFEEIGFSCLTESWNNRLMWSHYASSHSGICIGFKTSPSNEHGPLPFAGNCLPVKYSSNRPVWRFKDLAEGKPQEEILRGALLQKDEVWSYEKEWRFILDVLNPVKSYKAGDYRFFQKDEIVEIVFGLNADEGFIKSILGLIPGREIKIFRARFEDESYSLARERI